MTRTIKNYRADRRPELLLIGDDQQVLDMVVGEARAAGVDARAMLAAEADGTISGWFDVIAFCGQLGDAQRKSLEREALFHNPHTKFLRLHAPFAAWELLRELRPGDRPKVDLDAYFKRIGYSGPAEPTLEVLRSLHERHPAAIPFEAIDVLLDRRIDLSPGAIDAKLISGRRGGYCFEQNGLFSRVLEAIGFEVEGLAAHVRWMAEPGSPVPPLTHRVLRVMIEGRPWLADVGFGSAVSTAPLRMDVREPQPTRHDVYQLLPVGSQLMLRALVDGQWRPVYSIASEPMLDSHYEMANWYTSTHPDSHFRKRLIVTRTTPEARNILADGRLTVRRPGRRAEKHFLDAGQILETLESIFGLPVEPGWADIARRAAEAVETEREAEAA